MSPNTNTAGAARALRHGVEAMTIDDRSPPEAAKENTHETAPGKPETEGGAGWLMPGAALAALCAQLEAETGEHAADKRLLVGAARILERVTRERDEIQAALDAANERIADLESDLVAAEDYACRERHSAALNIAEARAEARDAEERHALERAAQRRREEKERQDREWARLTGRRW